MANKTVPGTARKIDDIRRIYEIAASRVAQRGRMTDQGKEYIQMINEIMDGMEINSVPFQVAVEYIKEAAGDQFDGKKLTSSLRAFLKTNAAKSVFSTFQDGRTLMIERANR